MGILGHKDPQAATPHPPVLRGRSLVPALAVGSSVLREVLQSVDVAFAPPLKPGQGWDAGIELTGK